MTVMHTFAVVNHVKLARTFYAQNALWCNATHAQIAFVMDAMSNVNDATKTFVVDASLCATIALIYSVKTAPKQSIHAGNKTIFFCKREEVFF